MSDHEREDPRPTLSVLPRAARPPTAVPGPPTARVAMSDLSSIRVSMSDRPVSGPRPSIRARLCGPRAGQDLEPRATYGTM